MAFFLNIVGNFYRKVHGCCDVYKQEKNDGFLPTARGGKKMGGAEGEGSNQIDGQGPKVQKHFEFSLYHMK